MYLYASRTFQETSTKRVHERLEGPMQVIDCMISYRGFNSSSDASSSLWYMDAVGPKIGTCRNVLEHV